MLAVVGDEYEVMLAAVKREIMLRGLDPELTVAQRNKLEMIHKYYMDENVRKHHCWTVLVVSESAYSASCKYQY